MGKKICITGGLGFIGQPLIKKLAVEGYEILNLDRSVKNVPPDLEGLAEFVECDIRDPKTQELVKGADTIVHLAALRSIKDSMDNPIEYNSINIDGTVNMLEAARINKVKSFIFSSSSAVYGDIHSKIQENEDLKPQNTYGLTKLSAEHYCSIYNSSFNLETVCLRLFNVYGPRQKPSEGVIPAFIDSAVNGKDVFLYGDGSQSRDFVFIDDVVSAFVAAIKNSSKANNMAINIGSGESHSVIEIINIIEKFSGKKIYQTKKSMLKWDVNSTVADISKAKEFLDWEPKYLLDEGVKLTYDSYLKNSGM